MLLKMIKTFVFAIIKYVVNFYSGSIDIKSKSDRGTEITVAFPYE